MTAIDAFTMKQSTFAEFQTPEWHRWAEGYTRSMRGEVLGTHRMDGFNDTAAEFTRDCSTTLSLAETFYVAPAMNTLITAAAEGWEADEEIHAEDFPTDHGWMWIPGGITTLDIRGTMCRTSALSWSRRGASVRMTFWMDKRHDSPAQKERAGEGWTSMPQLTPWHLIEQELGQPLGMALRMGTVLPPEISDQFTWVNREGSQTVSFPQGWTADQLKPVVAPDQTAAWMIAALRIMQQPLADTRSAGLPAPVRNAWKKSPVRVKNTHVTVIEFRRRAGEFEAGSGREFTHRFLRRGHWRKQWVGSERDGSRRQIRLWINPTIVGPEDKPLILREHVNALIR